MKVAKKQIGGLIILSLFCLLQISQQDKSLPDPRSNSTSISAQEFVWSQVEKYGVWKLKLALNSSVVEQYLTGFDGKQRQLASSWMFRVEKIVNDMMYSLIAYIPSEEFVKENPKREGFFNVYLTPEKNFAKKFWLNITALHSFKTHADFAFGMICTLPGIEPSIVKYILDSGIDVNGKSDQVKPLSAAAATGNLPLLKFLVENGANVDAAVRDPKGQGGRKSDKYISIFSKTKPSIPDHYKFYTTPMGIAVSKMNVDVIMHLLDNGANMTVRNTTWNTFLPPEIADFQLLLIIYVTHGFNVNATDAIGQTMLHATAAKGSLPMSEMLLKNHADVLAKDRFGWTPLHFAALYARNDTKQLIKLLLDQGSDVNAKTDGGFSPLNLLEAGSDLTFLDYLLTHLPLNTTSERKNIRLSEKDSRVDVVRLFLERGADPNHQDDILGWSTLHWAAAIGDSLVWKLLVEEYKANSSITSKLGWTPPDTAKYFNSEWNNTRTALLT